MRVLSVRQPWASLIASGKKTIELRSWRTNYRGPVLIVSGCAPWRGDHGFETGPLGQTICLVELIDVRPVTPADAAGACLPPPEGFDFAWVLAKPRIVKGASIKGKLGLYRADPTLLAAAGLG